MSNFEQLLAAARKSRGETDWSSRQHKVGLGGLLRRRFPWRCAVQYTGLVQVDPVTSALEADDYAYALPTCDPNVVISAKEMGGLADCSTMAIDQTVSYGRCTSMDSCMWYALHFSVP